MFFSKELLIKKKQPPYVWSQTVAGEYTLNLTKGKYHIVCIGAGGGGCGQGAKGSSYSAASGSAGAGVEAFLSVGSNFTLGIVVGASGEGKGGGDYTGTAGSGTLSRIFLDGRVIITCNGGGGGRTWFRGGSANGVGGSADINRSLPNLQIVRAVTGSDGTHGNWSGHFFECEPPLSDYPNYGFGGKARGDSSGYYYVADDGAPAYVLIERIF